MFPGISLMIFSAFLLITPNAFTTTGVICLHEPHSGNFCFQIFILEVFFGNFGGSIFIRGYSHIGESVFIMIKIKIYLFTFFFFLSFCHLDR